MNQYHRIYIAGPLTPRSDDQNHAVEYLGNCRQMFRAWLEAAEAIVLIPGRENSFGAKAEFELAVKLGKKVFYSIEEAKKYIQQ